MFFPGIKKVTTTKKRITDGFVYGILYDFVNMIFDASFFLTSIKGEIVPLASLVKESSCNSYVQC